MEIAITAHAQTRMQQRAIPVGVLDLLLDFGSSARSAGADRYYFDKQARRRLSAELDDKTLRGIERYLNTFAVFADEGHIITAGRRTRRLRRT